MVWFGEEVRFIGEAARHFAAATKILAVGTSLSVFPAAALVEEASFAAEKYLVAPEAESVPYGYRFICGNAASVVPHVVKCWGAGRRPC